MSDVPSTESTLTLIRNYDTLHNLKAQSFASCPRIRLNVTLSDLDASWAIKNTEELSAFSADIITKFVDARIHCCALHDPPELAQLQELRVCFEDRLVLNVM
jgi:hypothetical protein